MKLYISPSTQEKNVGPGGYIEETQMNLIADILIPELIRHGQTVKRNNHTAAGVEEICDESDAWGADYHIAIHSNAFKGTVRGCEVYCYDPAATTRKGTQMATAIYNSVVAIMPVPGRGIRSGATTMSEIAHTNAPSALIEIDYHDTADGAAWIMSHINEIAQALLLGILKQIGVAYIPIVDPKDAEIERLKAIIKERDIQVVELTATNTILRNTNETIPDLNAEITTQKADIARLESIKLSLEATNDSLILENGMLERDNAELDKKIAADKFKIDTIDQRERDHQEVVDNLKQQIAELQTKVNS